jgi:hypothetical protein
VVQHRWWVEASNHLVTRGGGVKRVKALVFNGYIRLLIDHITNVGDKLSNYNLDMM